MLGKVDVDRRPPVDGVGLKVIGRGVGKVLGEPATQAVAAAPMRAGDIILEIGFLQAVKCPT